MTRKQVAYEIAVVWFLTAIVAGIVGVPELPAAAFLAGSSTLSTAWYVSQDPDD